jgi:hypothetical protein
MPEKSKTQRREDAKTPRRQVFNFLSFLCGFAPLRLCVKFFLLFARPGMLWARVQEFNS